MTDSKKLKKTRSNLNGKIEIVLSELTNSITKMPIEMASIIELLESSVIIQIPRNFCAQGHRLTGDISSRGLKSDVDFNVTFKVESIENIDEFNQRIECSLSNFDDVSWGILRSSMEERQENASKLFETLRGIDEDDE